jgi:DNA uptake protein ComE-like DNA-binding protein
MKTYFISMLLLAGISTYAMPNNTSKNEKKATVTTISTVESNAAVAMKQLQDENMQLRQQMLNLANENEELKGMISFQTMMQKMFAQLGAQKQAEENEELKAQISYNTMMANVVKMLQTTTIK